LPCIAFGEFVSSLCCHSVFVENSMEKAMANRQGSHVHHS
jgi:hypothetical protein